MKKAYSITTEQRYFIKHKRELFIHPPVNFEIMIGDYEEEGCTGEFSITWEPLGGKDVAKIDMFDDSFIFLKEYENFFAKLATLGKNTEWQTIKGILDNLGFKDVTQRGKIV